MSRCGDLAGESEIAAADFELWSGSRVLFARFGRVPISEENLGVQPQSGCRSGSATASS